MEFRAATTESGTFEKVNRKNAQKYKKIIGDYYHQLFPRSSRVYLSSTSSSS